MSLSAHERRVAEAAFSAILGPLATEGLPAFDSVDLTGFYEAIGSAPGPLFEPGLRAMLAALAVGPLASGWRKPFLALSPEARTAWMESLEESPGFVARQLSSTWPSASSL